MFPSFTHPDLQLVFIFTSVMILVEISFAGQGAWQPLKVELPWPRLIQTVRVF
jgi:hypothetical protein